MIKKAMNNHKAEIIMWSLLSGDFDVSNTKEKCLNNVIQNAKEGSIVVFHDSEKAYQLMSSTLEGTLKYFSEKGYQFAPLSSAFN